MEHRIYYSRSFLTLLLFLICLIVSSAGCREKQPEPGPNEVWLIGWTYEPDTLEVAVGTTVTWNNTTREYHTVTSDRGLFDARLGFGESFNYTFNNAGTFSYHDGATDPPTLGKVIVR